MDNLGEFIRETRIKSSITLAQISKDTHIAQKYLEAIENEEFSIFPGEAYLKGFLRTYSIYLRLDPDDVIRRYERIKMAETPTPIEQLIPKPKPNFKPFLFIAGGVGAVILLFIIGSFIISNINTATFKNTASKTLKKNNENIQNRYTITTNDAELQKTFSVKQNDIIEIGFDNKKYEVKIKQTYPTVVIIDPNGKEKELFSYYKNELDLNNDQVNDVLLNLNTSDNKSALISVDLGENPSVEINGPLKFSSKENTETLINMPKSDKLEFSMNILNPTFLKYKLDDEEEVENFYQANTKKELAAKNKIIIWLSNAGFVTFNFSKYNKTYSPGYSGQIAVKLLEWNKNTNGSYDLQVSSLK